MCDLGRVGEVQAGRAGMRARHVRAKGFGGGVGEVCMVERGVGWVEEWEGAREGLGAFLHEML